MTTDFEKTLNDKIFTLKRIYFFYISSNGHDYGFSEKLYVFLEDISKQKYILTVNNIFTECSSGAYSAKITNFDIKQVDTFPKTAPNYILKKKDIKIYFEVDQDKYQYSLKSANNNDEIIEWTDDRDYYPTSYIKINKKFIHDNNPRIKNKPVVYLLITNYQFELSDHLKLKGQQHCVKNNNNFVKLNLRKYFHNRGLPHEIIDIIEKNTFQTIDNKLKIDDFINLDPDYNEISKNIIFINPKYVDAIVSAYKNAYKEDSIEIVKVSFKDYDYIKNRSDNYQMVFMGESGIGKSFLASLCAIPVYESDRAEKLPDIITEPIIVLGNKYKEQREEILKRDNDDRKLCEISFTYC